MYQIYIRIRRGAVTRTESLGSKESKLFADYGPDDKLMGIEIISDGLCEISFEDIEKD